VLTESSDPTGAIPTTTSAAFATLLIALRTDPHPTDPALQLTYDDNGTVRLQNTVTTTHPKGHAFVLGAQAGEFEHFVTGGTSALNDAPEGVTAFVG
jgi:hypothetical protein